jgi:hypothetical protein
MKAGFRRATLRSAGLIISILSKGIEGRFSESLASLGWIDNFDVFYAKCRQVFGGPRSTGPD